MLAVGPLGPQYVEVHLKLGSKFIQQNPKFLNPKGLSVNRLLLVAYI